jgi:hypothetical protein
MIKSRKIGWAGHGRDKKCIQTFWRENLKGRDHSEDLGVDGKTIVE